MWDNVSCGFYVVGVILVGDKWCVEPQRISSLVSTLIAFNSNDSAPLGPISEISN